MTNKIVAIIGSGIIGKSYAEMYALNGYIVHIYDALPEQINKCIENVKHDLIEASKIHDNIQVDVIMSRIIPQTDIKVHIQGAFIIQECVPERLEIKRSVYELVDPIMQSHQILSSSTSTLLPSLLSQNLKHKNRMIVCHPVNPINVVPIVEIVPAPWTDTDVVGTMKNVISQCGKEPIVLRKEIPGFIVNRLQYAILNECYNLVNNDILTVKDVDKVMSDGLCLRWAFLGPFQIAYLNANGWDDYCEKYSKTIKQVSDTFERPKLYEGKTSHKISNQLQKLIPLSGIQTARDKLARQMKALLKLKREHI